MDVGYVWFLFDFYCCVRTFLDLIICHSFLLSFMTSQWSAWVLLTSSQRNCSHCTFHEYSKNTLLKWFENQNSEILLHKFIINCEWHVNGLKLATVTNVGAWPASLYSFSVSIVMVTCLWYALSTMYEMKRCRMRDFFVIYIKNATVTKSFVFLSIKEWRICLLWRNGPLINESRSMAFHSLCWYLKLLTKLI